MFLSTGDTCRSPMAAGYFRQLLEDYEIEGFEIKTAGVMTVTGLRASQEALQVLEGLEIDISRHRSSQLTTDGIRRADLILGMSPLHVQHAYRESSVARGKTFLLKEFAHSDIKNIQISDPMGCTLEVFKSCFKEIHLACDKLAVSDFVTKLASAEEGHVTAQQAAEKIIQPERKKVILPPEEPEEDEAPIKEPEQVPNYDLETENSLGHPINQKEEDETPVETPDEELTPKKPEKKAEAKPAEKKKAEKRTPEKKSSDKKTPAKSATSKKAPAKTATKKAPAKKVPAKKAAKKATAKKAPAKKAPAKKKSSPSKAAKKTATKPKKKSKK